MNTKFCRSDVLERESLMSQIIHTALSLIFGLKYWTEVDNFTKLKAIIFHLILNLSFVLRYFLLGHWSHAIRTHVNFTLLFSFELPVTYSTYILCAKNVSRILHKLFLAYKFRSWFLLFWRTQSLYTSHLVVKPEVYT